MTLLARLRSLEGLVAVLIAVGLWQDRRVARLEDEVLLLRHQASRQHTSRWCQHEEPLLGRCVKVYGHLDGHEFFGRPDLLTTEGIRYRG